MDTDILNKAKYYCARAERSPRNLRLFLMRREVPSDEIDDRTDEGSTDTLTEVETSTDDDSELISDEGSDGADVSSDDSLEGMVDTIDCRTWPRSSPSSRPGRAR